MLTFRSQTIKNLTPTINLRKYCLVSNLNESTNFSKDINIVEEIVRNGSNQKAFLGNKSIEYLKKQTAHNSKKLLVTDTNILNNVLLKFSSWGGIHTSFPGGATIEGVFKITDQIKYYNIDTLIGICLVNNFFVY